MIAIFDIDNCIADDSHRRHLIDLNLVDIDERYKAYHELMDKDKLCNKHIVLKHIQRGDKIVFVTGRPEIYRQKTWIWLQRNFDHNLPRGTGLLMRPTGDHSPSHLLKPQLVLAFGSDNIGCAYDDLQSVLDAYLKIGIPEVHLVRINDATQSILRQAAITFEQRNTLYGDSYKSYGKVMMALFPNGLELGTVDEWNRFGVFSMIVSKLTRYAAGMAVGGHKDSAHDMCVYAAMLEELTK